MMANSESTTNFSSEQALALSRTGLFPAGTMTSYVIEDGYVSHTGGRPVKC